MRTRAPAKINWTLEVLGKRDDGYHEIRSVMQTIDICDELTVTSAPDLLERTRVPADLPPGTLVLQPLGATFYWASEVGDTTEVVKFESVLQALQLMDPDGQRDARISLVKKVPIAAGLGGGSSDAAAALRALNRLWNLGFERGPLGELGLQIGSDVPFFLSAGTALAEGRGEIITSLPDASSRWLVVLVPPIKMQDKTKGMYDVLQLEDFSDGTRTEALATRLRQSNPVRAEDLCNAFERPAYDFFEGLGPYRDALLNSGAGSVHLAGAGPALFVVFDSREKADTVASDLRDSDARAIVARTLSAEEATALVVTE